MPDKEHKIIISEKAMTLLNRDLTFQSISDELSDLTGKYVLPHGRILAAVDDSGRVIDCVAYHR